MNRNKIFRFMRESPLLFKRIKTKEGFRRNCYIVPQDWDDVYLRINKNYVRKFYSVYLCQSELVIFSKYDDMQVNIRYSDIDYLALSNDTLLYEVFDDEDDDPQKIVDEDEENEYITIHW